MPVDGTTLKNAAFPDWGSGILSLARLRLLPTCVRTTPSYSGPQNPSALLTPGGPRGYSDTNSWYDALQARTAIGLSRNNKTLYLLTVDRAGGSLGMQVGEVADLLIRDYRVYNALNLDGGGSTSMAMESPWRIREQ